MKTKLSRIICHCCRRKLVPTVSAVMLVAMVLQTATATPPFPVRVRPIPRPPAPKRIEMAPPQYGFQPTRWKAWPGQAESLQAAADRREQRRRSRYRTLEDVIQRDDEEAGGDLGDSTVETPGVESDAAPREDEYQIPGDAPLPEDPAEPPARGRVRCPADTRGSRLPTWKCQSFTHGCRRPWHVAKRQSRQAWSNLPKRFAARGTLGG